LPQKEGVTFQFPFQRRARSLSNPKQTEIQLKTDDKAIKEGERKKSPSPEYVPEKSTRGPVIAKTDFTL